MAPERQADGAWMVKGKKPVHTDRLYPVKMTATSVSFLSSSLLVNVINILSL